MVYVDSGSTVIWLTANLHDRFKITCQKYLKSLYLPFGQTNPIEIDTLDTYN